jgi:hypothetical protein
MTAKIVADVTVATAIVDVIATVTVETAKSANQ